MIDDREVLATVSQLDGAGFRADSVLIVGAEADVPAHLHALLDGDRVRVVADDASLAQFSVAAPYDRVIVTAPTRPVAWEWVQNTRAGGYIFCVLNPTGLAGQPAMLRIGCNGATGRFLPRRGGAPGVPDLAAADVWRSRGDEWVRRCRSRIPMPPWTFDVPWFLAMATLDDAPRLYRTGYDGLALHGRGGAWCEITPGDNGWRYVREGGPDNLFRHIADTYRQWRYLGSPGWERMRLTVTEEAHIVRLIGNDTCWVIPE